MFLLDDRGMPKSHRKKPRPLEYVDDGWFCDGRSPQAKGGRERVDTNKRAHAGCDRSTSDRLRGEWDAE